MDQSKGTNNLPMPDMTDRERQMMGVIIKMHKQLQSSGQPTPAPALNPASYQTQSQPNSNSNSNPNPIQQPLIPDTHPTKPGSVGTDHLDQLHNLQEKALQINNQIKQLEGTIANPTDQAGGTIQPASGLDPSVLPDVVTIFGYSINRTYLYIAIGIIILVVAGYFIYRYLTKRSGLTSNTESASASDSDDESDDSEDADSEGYEDESPNMAANIEKIPDQRT